MNDDIKLLLTESTKGLLSEETINKLVELNNKYVEDQLLEAAEKFVHKENEINEKFESLKADFVDWLDALSEEIYNEKSKKDGISEINEDVSKFMKILSEMNKKYMGDETEDDEEKESKDYEEAEHKKMKKNKKYAEQEKEDDEDKKEKEPDEKDDMQESIIAELKLKNNNLIKAGLIAENVTYNEKLSVKQKDDLCELCENQEFNGDVDVFLSFINQHVELALKGNDTISNSGMSNDPTIIKEETEQEEVIIDNVADSKVKKLKKIYRPVMNRSYEVDAKSAANKLV